MTQGALGSRATPGEAPLDHGEEAPSSFAGKGVMLYVSCMCPPRGPPCLCLTCGISWRILPGSCPQHTPPPPGLLQTGCDPSTSEPCRPWHLRPPPLFPPPGVLCCTDSGALDEGWQRPRRRAGPSLAGGADGGPGGPGPCGLCLFPLFSAFYFQKLLESESLLMPKKHLLCGQQGSSHIPHVCLDGSPRTLRVSPQRDLRAIEVLNVTTDQCGKLVMVHTCVCARACL